MIPTTAIMNGGDRRRSTTAVIVLSDDRHDWLPGRTRYENEGADASGETGVVGFVTPEDALGGMWLVS